MFLQSDNIELLIKLLEHCEKHYCKENILFLFDMNLLEKLNEPKEVENLCRRIYKKYIDRDAEHALNISGDLFNKIKEKYKNKQYDKLYEEAKQKMIEFINFDIMPRFEKEIIRNSESDKTRKTKNI